MCCGLRLITLQPGVMTRRKSPKNKEIGYLLLNYKLETNPRFRQLHENITISRTRSTDYTSKTSFNVRYYSEKVVERFIEIKHLSEFDAQTITVQTKDLIELVKQHSNGSVVISLGADGASMMSGEYAGVGEILRSQHFPWLLYTAHRLNWIVNDLVKDSMLAFDVLTTITRLYSFLNIAKIRPLYDKIFQEMYPRYLTQQFEVRWSCKFEAVDFVAEKPMCILAK